MWQEITTIEKAFEAKGIELSTLPDMFSKVPDEFRQHFVNEFTLTVCIAAVNENWVPDWTNTDQNKYFPWWWIIKRGSGAALSLDDVDCNDSLASVGARLVLENREKVLHMQKYFTPVFEQWYFNKK